MGNIYRCMKCGNNITAIIDEGLECPRCEISSGFMQVTEDNQNKLPYPTHLHEYAKENDSSFCNDLDGSKEGICPCEVFTAHLIDKKCNIIEAAIEKQPLYSTCQCKTSVSPCGHSTSHRLIDPCTGQP